MGIEFRNRGPAVAGASACFKAPDNHPLHLILFSSLQDPVVCGFYLYITGNNRGEGKPYRIV